MLRKIILKNTKTGEALTMPVTPPGYQVEIGRLVESLDMAQTGQINLPGLLALFNQQQEFLLPSEARSYTVEGYDGDAWAIVEKLVRWSTDGDVLRLIISDTPVNVPILLPPVAYGESDGTNDVTVKLTFRQYRDLTPETTENTATGNMSRSAVQATAATATYTVVSGDTLWGICRKYYGDGTLYSKLAAYNGIKNANLIRVGQKFTIPDKSLL